MKRNEVFARLRTPALGGDLTSVKCHGEWLPLGLAVDDTTGLVLTVDELSAEDAETLQEWLEPIAEAVEAKLLVSDDADASKTVADELGLEHQVCKGHVKRNTEVLIDTLASLAGSDQDGSSAAIGVTPEQALQDLKRLGELILSRQLQEEEELGEMHQRYIEAAPGQQKATISIVQQSHCVKRGWAQVGSNPEERPTGWYERYQQMSANAWPVSCRRSRSASRPVMRDTEVCHWRSCLWCKEIGKPGIQVAVR